MQHGNCERHAAHAGRCILGSDGELLQCLMGDILLSSQQPKMRQNKLLWVDPHGQR